MKKLRIYVYPDRSYSLKPDTNPYVKDLANALEASSVVVVHSKTAWLGVIDIFLHLRRTDAVVFNWIEEVANRTMGYVQAIALVFLLPILKVTGVKIIWTVHNKISHNTRNRWISNHFRRTLVRQADIVVAHAKESLQAINAPLVRHYPHPFKDIPTGPLFALSFQYDILIWGTIQPYKGIREFLEYVHEKGHTNLRICVQGKCPDIAYSQSLKNLETDSIQIVNRFTDDDELKRLFAQARIIVFTYRSESVLSSGALIESLTNYKTVIGPDFGNFRDCAQEGLSYTYTDFDDLIRLVTDLVTHRLPLISEEKIDAFMRQHSWDAYARFLKAQLTGLSEPARETVA